MPASTPAFAFPYPLATEPVSQGDDAIKALAEKVEDELIPAWTAAALASSWTNPGGFSPPGYCKIGKEVRLRGPVTGGTLGNAAMNLPAGFRPEFDLCFIVWSTHASGWSRMRIRASDGAVYLDTNPVGGAGAAYFHDNISFVAV